MTNFFLSVLASIVAAIVVVSFAFLVSRKARKLLTAIAAVLLHVEIRNVYSDGEEAEPFIKEALRRTKSVRIFAGRGNQFQRDLYEAALVGVLGRKPNVRVLLPDPESEWVDYRERELSRLDPSFGGGTLRRQIKTVLGILAKFIEDARFEVRMYDFLHIGRIILTDESLFLTAYSEGFHGRHSRVYQYARGDIYDMFSRFFEMAWDASSVRILTRQSREVG